MLGIHSSTTNCPPGARWRAAFRKHSHLLVLRTQVADAVPHDVDERELTRNGRRGHVPDDHRQLLRGHLPPQLVGHRLRQLDAGHRDTACEKRDRYPARADRELQRRTAAGQPREEVDRRIEHVRGEHLGRAVVISLCGFLVPQIAARHDQDPGRAGGRPPPNFHRETYRSRLHAAVTTSESGWKLVRTQGTDFGPSTSPVVPDQRHFRLMIYYAATRS